MAGATVDVAAVVTVDQVIVTRLANDVIVAGFAIDVIVTIAPANYVVSVATVDDVITAESDDHVTARRADNDVVIGRAHNRGGLTCACVSFGISPRATCRQSEKRNSKTRRSDQHYAPIR